jgi:glycosyltransferase involved in cell wall biosynthesis
LSDLVVSAFTPALGTGFGVRTYGIVRALSALGPVDLVYSTFGAPQPGPEFQSIPSLTLHGVRPSRGPRRLATYLRARSFGWRAGFARGVSPELVGRAAELAADPRCARVIADGPVAMGAVLQLNDPKRVVYNAHNLESSFRHLMDSGGKGRRASLENFERRLIERAAASWMVSRADVEGARALVPGAEITYVPNVVDVAAIRPVAYPSGGARILFVGNFEWEPNREALRFLVDEILPSVWEEIPEARLAVVGRGLERPVSDDARVEQLGFVDDLAGAYAAADCVAVPLLTSGGSPLKFVEALAYGVPVVATPDAAAGLEARGGEHYLEAADPGAFAAAIARVLRGEASDVRDRGRELAQRAYSIESLVDRVAP